MIAAAAPKAKYSVFEAADSMQVPAVGASVLDTAKAAAQTEEALTGVGGSDIKTVSSEDVTLADGKPRARLLYFHGNPPVTMSPLTVWP